MAEDRDALAALAYEQAVRSFDQQASVLDNLRSRAGILLSAAAVATGFLAGIALGDSRSLSPWGWIATLAFLGLAGLSVWILRPMHNWSFSPGAKKLVQNYVDPPGVTIFRAHRNLALHMHQAWHDNNKRLGKMILFFEIACILLGVEVAFWVIDLVWGG